MNRRSAIKALCALCGCVRVPATAQQLPKVPMVGILRLSAADPKDPAVWMLDQAFRGRGYTPGADLRVEYRFADGHPERMPQMAAELVQAGVDVLIATSEQGLRAAKQATDTIPIVSLMWDYDAVATGLIESYARPSGNVTGVSLMNAQLVAKRVELLIEAVPRARRVAVLWDTFSQRQLEQVQAAVQSLPVRLSPVEMQDSQYERAIKLARARADAALLLFSPKFYSDRLRIAALALQAKLPTIHQDKWYAQAGGLMSYGPDTANVMERTTYLVDRLLKGARPSDLPVEQATKFQLTVNLKTAKALGIRIPQAVLLRAEEVIQ